MTSKLTCDRDENTYVSLADESAPRGYWSLTNGSRDSYLRAPGPLTISAVALFGNESFFSDSKRLSAANTTDTEKVLCEPHSIPFKSNDFLGKLTGDSYCDRMNITYFTTGENQLIADRLLNWFTDWFNQTDYAKGALGLAMFYANNALLTNAAIDPYNPDELMDETDADYKVAYPRLIYTSEGLTTPKPSMALYSLILLSVLLIVEVVLLVWLARYAWKTPTWTSTFKSLIVAQLANAMEKGTLPSAGRHSKNDLKILKQMDGRIGVEVRSGIDGESEVRQLMHGGSESVLP